MQPDSINTASNTTRAAKAAAAWRAAAASSRQTDAKAWLHSTDVRWPWLCPHTTHSPIVLTPPCPPNHTSAILVSWLSGLQSTLFNAIVENGKAAAANFPFCTIEPNVGMVTVPDARLQQLSDVSKSRETVGQGEGGRARGGGAERLCAQDNHQSLQLTG